MEKIRTLNLLILHSYHSDNKEDKEFSKFVMKNYMKGVLISNGLVFMFYLTRFKNYRNSHLLLGNNLFLYIFLFMKY